MKRIDPEKAKFIAEYLKGNPDITHHKLNTIVHKKFGTNISWNYWIKVRPSAGNSITVKSPTATNIVKRAPTVKDVPFVQLVNALAKNTVGAAITKGIRKFSLEAAPDGTTIISLEVR